MRGPSLGHPRSAATVRVASLVPGRHLCPISSYGLLSYSSRWWSPRGDAARTHRATRPRLAPAPNELQLADQYGQVADDMCAGLNENRIPSTAELDAWARELNRLDSERGSRQSDGRTGVETRLGKGWVKVGQRLGSLARERRPGNLLNDEIAAAVASPVGAGAWGTA